MKALIATCFESNEERASFVYDACIKKGLDAVLLTSDFSHMRKTKRESIPEHFNALHARPYHKNLSVKRMHSHYRFAKDLFVRIEEEDPDLIWLMAPANSLIKEAETYKKKHPEKKLIIDIIDMWPESLPMDISKDVFPLNLWRNIRRKHIGCADLLVSECDLYQNILSKEYKGRIKTIRWARKGKSIETPCKADDDPFVLVYIGSINNIIDTERIAKLISSINKPVVLHVIGEGENTSSFIKQLGEVCEVIYHGPIRDEEKKKAIFELCHSGINIYKEGLYIGLTVKCIDYFQHGLPIINNIKGDTSDLVERYQAGINVDENNSIDEEKLIQMRKNNQNIYALFDENLSYAVFEKECMDLIEEVMQ